MDEATLAALADTLDARDYRRSNYGAKDPDDWHEYTLIRSPDTGLYQMVRQALVDHGFQRAFTMEPAYWDGRRWVEGTKDGKPGKPRTVRWWYWDAGDSWCYFLGRGEVERPYRPIRDGGKPGIVNRRPLALLLARPEPGEAQASLLD
jgi:hypothetical protein